MTSSDIVLAATGLTGDLIAASDQRSVLALAGERDAILLACALDRLSVVAAEMSRKINAAAVRRAA